MKRDGGLSEPVGLAQPVNRHRVETLEDHDQIDVGGPAQAVLGRVSEEEHGAKVLAEGLPRGFDEPVEDTSHGGGKGGRGRDRGHGTTSGGLIIPTILSITGREPSRATRCR